jgi:uncharacterized membrane protein YkoI
MNNNYSILRIILGIIMLLAPLQTVMADDDYIEVRRLLNSGEILPLEVILKNVKQTFPGKILEIELEKEDHHIVYEIEILGSDGIVREIYMDAKSGMLLYEKEDD